MFCTTIWENGKFEDATAKAKLPTTGTRWGTGCAFVDYDRDGYVDLLVSNYVDAGFEFETPARGSESELRLEGPAGDVLRTERPADGPQHTVPQ